MDTNMSERPVIEITGARKLFGAVKALDGADFAIAPGECVGLVGHNGAGKSTLVNVINGGLGLNEGQITLSSGQVSSDFSIRVARAQGIRCVFQELSLCPNLSVVENMRIAHSGLSGPGWRSQARSMVDELLDKIFPGHGIDSGRAVSELSIAQRQMAEIAIAFSSHGAPTALVILDEPTSSLDASRAEQLIAYVKTFNAAGGAVIFISHILGEVLDVSDRIVVMRDGKVVSDKPSSAFTVGSLVQAMGSVAAESAGRRTVAKRAVSEAPVIAFPRERDAVEFEAFKGELVGLAGLSGHGQTQLIVDLFMSVSGDWWARREPVAAFVAGDRIVDGVFPIWSILLNMTIAVLGRWQRFGLTDRAQEAEYGRTWHEKIGIRTPNLDHPILSLSGGNQQKALFARALGTSAPLVLMDDPMRGVDIGTKQDVYQMLREEADSGRTFIWYSTEMDEVCVCDRVYVFREGRIVRELEGDAVSEENILAASFGERVA
nr:sugar ABC transporter ATP-binding protein [Pelagibacterium limicola]